MNKNKKIRESVEKIEPRAEAEQRMYQNILAKAEKKKQAQKPMRIIRMAVPIAACLCIAILGVVHFLPINTPFEQPGDTNPPVLGGSPYEDVSSAEDFERIGISLEAPSDAQSVSYYIYDGVIACIDFTLDNCGYTLMGSSQSGDFSGIIGNVIGSEQIDAERSGVLEMIDCSPSIYYKISWTDGKTNYILYSADDCDESSIRSVYEKVIAES